MYRIALCDDNAEFAELAVQRIEQYCRRHDTAAAVKTFDSSEDIVCLIEQKQMFDVYVLDVEMPGYSGIEVAGMIRECSETAAIILLTAYTAYAIEACGMNIFRYVVKNDFETELDRVLGELFDFLECQENDKIYIISNKRKFIKLYQKEIVYICKDQKNSVFTLSDGRQETERVTLQVLYKKLDNPDLVFLDRGLILNLPHIRRVSVEFVETDDGSTFYTDKEKIRALKASLAEYWGKFI